MKTEISAGGIVVRREHGIWEVLVVRDMNDNLTFPKGLIEQGEDPVSAAKREIAEEVGLTKMKMLTELPPIKYLYTRGELISKTVHYFIFLAVSDEPLTPQTTEGIHDASYMSLKDAVDHIGYPKTNKPLLEKTRHYLLSE